MEMRARFVAITGLLTLLLGLTAGMMHQARVSAQAYRFFTDGMRRDRCGQPTTIRP